MNTGKTPAPGSLRFSGNAVLKIAETAAAEVSGAALSKTGKLALPKGAVPMLSQPVRVRYSAESLTIDVTVVVLWGYNARTVAEAVQDSVKTAVQSMTGIAVSKVNVKIAGLCPQKTE